MNTIPAFLLAAELGADGIELDVRRARDGQIVVIHDATVDATTNGTGVVADLTLAELQRFAPRIPTLGEVFEAVGEQFVCINVELKEVGLEQAVAECIARHGMTERVLISSFSTEALRRMQAVAPHLPCGFLIGRFEDLPEAAHWQILHPHHSGVTAERMAVWKQAGKIVNAWTVNDPAEIVRLADLGVDGIITDVPEVARRELTRLCRM